MQKSEGSFYVRESASKIGAFTVDIKTNSAVEPIVAKRIYRTDDGFFQYEGDADSYVSMRVCLQNCADFKISLPPSILPKCAAKLALCIGTAAETRRRTKPMCAKCKYVSEQPYGGRTCSKPALDARPYCVFHTCKHTGCPTPKSSKAELCPEHGQTQA